MQSVFAVILVLGGLIFFHELGHFLAARLMGIGVKTFSLGFGPRLFGFTRGKTDYRLAAIPLGGYVSLVGESDTEDMPEGFTASESFILRPTWHRMVVVVAGPLFNFFLAFLIYWGLFWAQGQMMVQPLIGEVKMGSPAYEAGIKPGDRVVDIDGRTIDYWSDLSDTVAQNRGNELAVTVLRDGHEYTYRMTPEMDVRPNLFGEEIRTPLIGVLASGETVNVPLAGTSSAVEAVKQTWFVTKITLLGIKKLIERIVPFESVGGPIMIAQMVSQQAEVGLANVLVLAALISINLGVLNLLPIPVLDGGHLIFLTLETIRRKPVSVRMQEMTVKVGLALLLTLMLFATYNDLQRLFR